MRSPPWLLVLRAYTLLVQRLATGEYRFATLFNISKSVYASADGVLAVLGESQAGAVEQYSTPTVLLGQPDDPGEHDIFQLAEWSNFALAGREFVTRTPRSYEPHVVAIFAVEAARVDVWFEGSIFTTRVLPAGAVEHVTGDFYPHKDVEVISTGDVLVATTSGGSVFSPIPPAAEEIFGMCTSACRISVLGGDTSILLTRSCTDGTVEQVSASLGFYGNPLYDWRTCRWAAPSGYKIAGRTWADGGGLEAATFLSTKHFQLLTPLPTRVRYLLLISDVPALCSYGSDNLTLTGAVGVYHARLMDVAAGTVFECDAPVTAIGDAFCPGDFDRSCSAKEMNIVAAPLPESSTTTLSTSTSTSATATETNTTSWTTTSKTTTRTSSATTTTTETNTTSRTTTATKTTRTSSATSATTKTNTASRTTTATETTRTSSATSTTTETNTTSRTTTATKTTRTSTITNSVTSVSLTPTTSATTVTLTPTATTSATTVSLTSTATTSATTVSLTSTPTPPATPHTNTSSTAVWSPTTVTHTSAALTSGTSATHNSTATTAADVATHTTTPTAVAVTSVTAVEHGPVVTTLEDTHTITTTPTTPTATAHMPTTTLETPSGRANTTTTTATGTAIHTATTHVSAHTAATTTTHTATGTTTSTTTLAAATVYVQLVESWEASLFSALVDANSSTHVKDVDGFILVAAKVDASAIAAAGGNLTVVAEGSDAAAIVSTSLLDSLGAEDGLVLVLTSFDAATASSMSTDGGPEAIEPSVQVRAAVNVNVFTLNGTRLSVANLKDPVRVVLPLNHSSGVECVFWDEANSRWASEGVVLSLADGRVVCETSHLTLFAALGRGFVDTLACSQATLLSADALQELAKGDWCQTLGAKMLGGFIAAFFLLLAVAALLDWRRWKQGRHSDEHFLIPLTTERRSIPNIWREASEAAAKGCCQTLRQCCWGSGALRDALDDVISNWATHFSEVRDFLEGFFGGLELCPTGCHRCGANCPVVFIQHVMSTTLAVCARRQVAAVVGISHNSSYFLIQNDDVCDVLLAHRARSWEGSTNSATDSVSAKVLKCEEAWGRLHREVGAKLDAFMEAAARWSSLPGTVWHLFRGQNPFGASLVHCAFTSSKTRVLLLMVEITGALMLATLFFSASGVPGKRNRSRNVDCTFNNPFKLVGRIFAIGTGSVLIAGIPSMFLGSLCTRGMKKFDYEGCPAWNRQLRVWRIQDAAIWVLGLLYLGGCTFFMSLFLANIAKEDQGGWLLSGLVSVVEDTLIIPFAVSLALPLLCTACLAFLSRHRGVKKEDLISERLVQIRRQGNLTLPVERV